MRTASKWSQDGICAATRDIRSLAATCAAHTERLWRMQPYMQQYMTIFSFFFLLMQAWWQLPAAPPQPRCRVPHLVEREPRQPAHPLRRRHLGALGARGLWRHGQLHRQSRQFPGVRGRNRLLGEPALRNGRLRGADGQRRQRLRQRAHAADGALTRATARGWCGVEEMRRGPPFFARLDVFRRRMCHAKC